MKVFLSELFKTVDKAGIEYCILRNYDKLPASTGGSDIDVLVAPEYLDEFSCLVSGLISKYDGDVVVSYGLKNFKGLCFVWRHLGFVYGLQLDIHTDEVFRGLTYFDRRLILSRSWIFNDIVRVAKENDAMMLAFLKEALNNGKSRKDYLSSARKAYNTERSLYRELLKKYFGRKCSELWDGFFLQTDSTCSLRRISLLARWHLLRESCQNSLAKTVLRKLGYGFGRWRRLFSPIGFSVAFIGTDGSGKSTIIDGIRSPLENALHSSLKYEHMRPNFLPSLARLLGCGGHEAGGPVTDPHGSSVPGFWGSLFRLVYYSFDYILGYWFKVYPDKVRKPCLYIFDRYFYDYLIDPARSRISLPEKLLEWWRIAIPEPDLVLCLGADPAIIHARKPELPLHEVKRQVQDLRMFCQQNSGRAVWIDTGLPVEESVSQALQAIVDRMAARYE